MKKILLFLNIVLLMSIYSCSKDPVTDVTDESTRREPNTIKILAIGNSFSRNAVYFLPDVARESGVNLVVGNLYVPSCSLQMHWNNASKDIKAYEYNKVEYGKHIDRIKVSIKDALNDVDWDYVVVQQVSELSGVYSTYFPYLPYLMKYIRANSKNPNVAIAIHQVWAYAQSSTYPGFINYNKDQVKMYQAIFSTVQNVARLQNIQKIIPSGRAIQMARNEPTIGDNLCEDGRHLNNMGKHIAAYVWGDIFFPRNIIVPEKDPNVKLLKVIAYKAVQEQKKQK